MRHHLFTQADQYPVAVLIKSSSFSKRDLEQNYIDPLINLGLKLDDFIAFTLEYNEVGKAPVRFIKEYLDSLLPPLKELGTEYLYVADSAYFKVLTREAKAEAHHGYVLPCRIPGYEHMKVVLGINYQAFIYNPDLQSKCQLGLNALASHRLGTYQVLGDSIIHSAQYPKGYTEVAAALAKLHKYKELTCDIEAFSLRFNEAGIGTIAFAWDQHNGIAFACDYSEFVSHEEIVTGIHGANQPNQAIRKLLLKFFMEYEGNITWHNASYDIEVIIFVLWMKNLLDTQGLLNGLDVMTRCFDDTKIIAYLAVNSTAGNALGLKPLAHEFAGNYAVEEITDIRKIPLDKLLQYNLVDALSTWYVKNKFYPIMVQDKQDKLYKELMLPSLQVIMQMELTGMPMDTSTIADARAKLEKMEAEALAVLRNNPLIKMLDLLVQTKMMDAANAKLKTIQHPIEKYKDELFNPNSGPQVRILLYEKMGMPVLDKTETGLPAVGAETLEKLINHTEIEQYKEILRALIDYSKVTKILSTFIPAFEKGIVKADGMQYLHGSFNLGGTVSGRLSSSDPNLQNLPSGSTFGKLVKQCFQAPKGWLFVGADFASLEDYISALTTKDPNKLRVYEDGFDGHCLRAAYYFRDQLGHIDLDSPASVNTIKETHPELRQDSKPGTFLLTYGGTYHGLVNNLGWSKEKALAVEANYHKLYKVSDDYVQTRLLQASKDGYVDVAFGLRVRTPLLSQIIFNSKSMPYEAAAEGRTAGNALGQSYGLLNNRAANAFMRKVWKSKFKYDIKPVSLIHDAAYLLIRDDLEVVEWVNRNLIDEMRWQELPELRHDTVKIGAALDIFWPSWKNKLTLPNDANQETIFNLCKEHRKNPSKEG